LKNKYYRKIGISLGLIFVLANIVAFSHAYKFTHFSENDLKKTSKDLTFTEKVKIMVFGINNPRPKTNSFPIQNYETFTVDSNVKLECWKIEIEDSKGTVILFHGYGGEKSSLLDKSELFNELGFTTILVDFSGSGGSEGKQTTIGFNEGLQVKDVYKKILANDENNIYLFGTSMGAVAIMKAVNDGEVSPNGLILECPFGTMYETVKSRFEILNVPSFPMAELLMFWGGIQNGFWAFNHNPKEYAKKIETPVLLMYGAHDEKVSLSEIDEIFNNLKGEKELKTYPQSGHENYLIKYKKEWKSDVETFLTKK
jgi:alpha-beta hydrolase superfamily lysophospholipase